MSLQGSSTAWKRLVRKTEFAGRRTEWGDYYEETNYSDEAFEEKKKIVVGIPGAREAPARSGTSAPTPASSAAWPAGGGIADGRLRHRSGRRRAELPRGRSTGRKRASCRSSSTSTNPSPAIGWANENGTPGSTRGPVDAILALALVHHLAISNNLPFARIADFFRRICDRLIIEFVPKSDSQVRRLLPTREDVFPGYAQQAFEAEFGRHFTMERSVPVKGSERTLYLMKARDDRA